MRELTMVMIIRAINQIAVLAPVKEQINVKATGGTKAKDQVKLIMGIIQMQQNLLKNYT